MSQPFSHNTHTLEKDTYPGTGVRSGYTNFDDQPTTFDQQGPTQSFGATNQNDFDLSPTHNYSGGTGAGAAPIHQGTHIRQNNNNAYDTPTNTFGSANQQGLSDTMGTEHTQRNLEGTGMYGGGPTTVHDSGRPNTHGDRATDGNHQNAVGAVGGPHSSQAAKPGLGDKFVGKTQEVNESSRL